jgi:hypothetical protein
VSPTHASECSLNRSVASTSSTCGNAQAQPVGPS